MFEDFNINKYKTLKYPNDNSLKALNEIKYLQKKPLDVGFASTYDDISKSFERIFRHRLNNFPQELVKNLIDTSRPVIMKIKNYHNRKRPNVLAGNFGIDLRYFKTKSAQTPAFPSGHSAQGTLISFVLSDMFPSMKNEFKKVADNISESRIAGRVHYLSDKIVGEQLGVDLYNHLNTP